MYLPKFFEETRVEVLHALIHAYPFGTLVTLTAGGLDANHIPFEVDSDPRPFGTLRGHVARANPVWREAAPDAEALEIPIARLIGKWKVSQNRPPQDRAGVVAGLLQEAPHSAAAMADWVRRSKSE